MNTPRKDFHHFSASKKKKNTIASNKEKKKITNDLRVLPNNH